MESGSARLRADHIDRFYDCVDDELTSAIGHQSPLHTSQRETSSEM
jgi:hypothetical protein